MKFLFLVLVLLSCTTFAGSGESDNPEPSSLEHGIQAHFPVAPVPQSPQIPIEDVTTNRNIVRQVGVCRRTIETLAGNIFSRKSLVIGGVGGAVSLFGYGIYSTFFSHYPKSLDFNSLPMNYHGITQTSEDSIVRLTPDGKSIAFIDIEKDGKIFGIGGNEPKQLALGKDALVSIQNTGGFFGHNLYFGIGIDGQIYKIETLRRDGVVQKIEIEPFGQLVRNKKAVAISVNLTKGDIFAKTLRAIDEEGAVYSIRNQGWTKLGTLLLAKGTSFISVAPFGVGAYALRSDGQFYQISSSV